MIGDPTKMMIRVGPISG